MLQISSNLPNQKNQTDLQLKKPSNRRLCQRNHLNHLTCLPAGRSAIKKSRNKSCGPDLLTLNIFIALQFFL